MERLEGAVIGVEEDFRVLKVDLFRVLSWGEERVRGEER